MDQLGRLDSADSLDPMAEFDLAAVREPSELKSREDRSDREAG
jgi:hypothetical protein